MRIVQLARKLLGPIAPNVVNVTLTQTAYAYGQPRFQGGEIGPINFLPMQEDAVVASRLATILCSLSTSSDNVVDNYVIPRLAQLILLVKTEDTLYKGVDKELRVKYPECLKVLRAKAPVLKELDLNLCHPDPNPFNVRPSVQWLSSILLAFKLYKSSMMNIDESSPLNIVGLIERENTRFLPIGMKAYRIQLNCCPKSKSAQCRLGNSQSNRVSFFGIV